MMRKKYLFALVLMIFSVAAIEAATIHLIMVYETEDQNIGATADATLMKAQVNNIAQITNMEVRVHEFDRRDSQVAGFLTSFRAGQDDVVWFHYSGHGANSGDGWPQYTDGSSRYAQTEVHELLMRCGARLNITMYDACNIGATEHAWSRTSSMPGNQLTMLFKKASGDILISSAADAEYSWGSPQTGGFATTSLTRAINQVEFTPQDTPRTLWTKVLNKMKSGANTMCQSIRKRPQNPKWDMNLSRDPENDAGANVHNTPIERPDIRSLKSAFGN